MEAVTIIATIIGIVVGLVTLIKEWSVIVRASSALKKKIASSRVINVHRRNFIMAFSVGVAGLIVYASLPLIKEATKKLSGIRRPSDKDRFVKNEETGVIHHLKACAHHLPKKLVAVESDEIISSKSIHSTKLVHIASLEEISDERISLLINAIKKSPTSTHLYKYLVSEWGRNKEYSRIHKLFEANLEYLNSRLLSYSDDKRLSRKYSKAIAELEQRRGKARYHEKMASLS